ncbi:MAG: transcriptional regulator [Planctomycetota bacterium]|nr:MAG: transcriptional regulator [Planctomycetota bacterium]
MLAALGERLARRRLELNCTQAQLAKEAGVSLRTLGRIEAGESTQLTNLIRVLRALGLLEHFDSLLPPPTPSPLEQLRNQGKRRRRASPRSDAPTGEAEWTWDDPDHSPDHNSGDDK